LCPHPHETLAAESLSPPTSSVLPIHPCFVDQMTLPKKRLRRSGRPSGRLIKGSSSILRRVEYTTSNSNSDDDGSQSGSSSCQRCADEDSSSISPDSGDDGDPLLRLRKYQSSLLGERLDQLKLPPSTDGVDPTRSTAQISHTVKSYKPLPALPSLMMQCCGMR
jgi:hypothetical protein